MKKTLIALAVLAASGASFAQVTITGTFDPAFAATTVTYGNGTAVSNNLVRNGSQGTTNITFSGSEDLGGGLKALFLYEADFNSANQAGATNALGMGGGEIYTGLAGSFGSIKLGAPNTPSLTVQASRQPFGTKIGGGFAGVLGTGHVREDNSINYTSPAFMGGLTAAVNYSNSVSADTVAAPAVVGVNSKNDIGVMYSSGPLFAGVSFYKQDGTNQQTNLAVNYNFGVAKVYLGGVNETRTVAGVDSQYAGTNIGVAVPLGQITLLANVAALDDKSTANNDKSIRAIGLRYDLSKRTSVYGRFINETTDNVAATTVKDTTTSLVGIQHNF